MDSRRADFKDKVLRGAVFVRLQRTVAGESYWRGLARTQPALDLPDERLTLPIPTLPEDSTSESVLNEMRLLSLVEEVLMLAVNTGKLRL